MGKAAAKAEFGLWERDVVYTLRQWIIQMQNWLKASTHAAVTWICRIAKVDFFFFFSWRAQTSLSSPPVSTVSPQEINTTNTFTALVEAGHTQLPTIMSQHWRKFTTKEEHLSKRSGNKAGAVLPHEICLVIRHQCMCVLYFIFRQIAVLSQARCLDMIVDQTASLHLLFQPSSCTSGVWMESVIFF